METTFMTFPLEQIGWGLRQLSLSGAMGNIIAIIIYFLIGFIPCGVYWYLRKNGKLYKIDAMLPLLSVLLWIVLYYMINPGLFQTPVAGGGKIILAGTFYSVFVGYLVLRVLKSNVKADMKALQKRLRILIYLVMVLFAVVVIIECFVNLPDAIQSVREGNSVSVGEITYDSVDLTMTYIFLVLQSVVNMLPYIANMIVLFFTIHALNELLEDSYSDEAIAAVKKISDYCAKALTVIVVSEMSFNIAQLIFKNQIAQIHISTTIPIFAILLIVAILVMARYIEENQKLKQDNDLFI